MKLIFGRSRSLSTPGRSLVDRYIVQARLAKIREYLALLRKVFGQANEAEFIKDPLITETQSDIFSWQFNAS